MSETFSQQLNQIITLSEKILLWLSNEFKQTNNQEEELNTEELQQWSSERDKLIKLTLNEQHFENYSLNLPLINKVVLLDQQLTQQAAQSKLLLKTSLLQMKKNQKATNSYKKY